MIWDSHPWKDDLRKRAEWLQAKTTQRRWSEAAFVRVEQSVMIGCYCVRKLIEAGKLTDSVTKQTVPVVVYKAKGKPVHSLNWHHIAELYDLQRGVAETKPFTFVCNQLIHSFVYANGFSQKGGLDFVRFCSDYQRNTNLFQVSVDDLAKVFLAVANDDVVEADYAWNEEKKEKERDYDRVQK